MTRLSSVVVSWLGAQWRSRGSEMDEWHVCQSRNFRDNVDKGQIVKSQSWMLSGKSKVTDHMCQAVYVSFVLNCTK